MKKLAAMLILAMSSQAAFAGFVTGNQLNTWADSKNRINNGVSQGDDYSNSSNLNVYIWGISDAYGEVIFCIPDKTQTAQISAIVMQYVKSHPEQWNNPANAIIVNALVPVFPCKKK